MKESSISGTVFGINVVMLVLLLIVSLIILIAVQDTTIRVLLIIIADSQIALSTVVVSYWVCKLHKSQ